MQQSSGPSAKTRRTTKTIASEKVTIFPRLERNLEGWTKKSLQLDWHWVDKNALRSCTPVDTAPSQFIFAIAATYPLFSLVKSRSTALIAPPGMKIGISFEPDRLIRRDTNYLLLSEK